MPDGTRDIQEFLNRIVQNVGAVIVGKRHPIEMALLSLLCGGHILIEDVPGVGKTMLVSALSRSIQCTYRRIQFTPDIMPSDITGFSLYNQKTGEFEYREGLVFSSFVLADEINRAPPRTQAALLEVMQECRVTVDGQTYDTPRPFMVLATQNPADFVGTYPLPEAQMDRFLLRVSMGYPTLEDESYILRRYKETNPLDSIHPVAAAADIEALQKAVREVHVDDSLYDYIVKLVRATREHPSVALGVSPRGSLALFHTAQALALYHGRGYVTPDDIKPLCIPTLAHRLVLKQEARMQKIKPESILWSILQSTPVPEGRRS